MTNYIHKSLVESVQFFQDADPYFASSVSMKLELAVFMPNVTLFKLEQWGQRCTSFNMVLLMLWMKMEKTFITLDEGSHFGGQKTHRQSLHAISALQGPTVNLTSNPDSSGTPV